MSKHTPGPIKPCPQCGANAHRFPVNGGTSFPEIIACSRGCGYPRLMPHVRSEWMAADGWNDLAAMWNSCRIEVDAETGIKSLRWSKGPAYQEAPEIVGRYLPWSPAISIDKVAARAAIANTTGGAA